MKSYQKFWEGIAFDIEQKYKKGHPSTWKKSDIEIFRVHLEKHIIDFCKSDHNKAACCGIDHTIKGIYLVDKYKAPSYDTLHNIFVLKKSSGKVKTRHQFAIYLGYDSYLDYLDKKGIVLSEEKISKQLSKAFNAIIKHSHPTLFIQYLKNKAGQYEAHLQTDPLKTDAFPIKPSLIPLDHHFFDTLKSFESYKKNLLESGFVRGEAQRTLSFFSTEELEKQIGLEIYERLFPPQSNLRLFLEYLLARLEKQKSKDLNLIISSPEAQITNIPFELIFRQKRARPMVVRFDNLLLARSLDAQLQDFSTNTMEEVALPLRILFVTALPVDTERHFIDLEKEQEEIWKVIEKANNYIIHALQDLPSKRRVVIEFMEIGSIQRIENALAAGKHHILHISGHGFYYDAMGIGYLNLETENGKTHQVSAVEFAQVIQPFKKHLKMVFLSSCETGRTEGNSVAGALVATGIPIVIGMRYPIQDHTATLFTSTFYEQLCNGHTLAEALYFARHMIYKAPEKKAAHTFQLKTAEWFTPFLFLNQPVKRIINPYLTITEGNYFHQHYRPDYYFKGSKDGQLNKTVTKLVAKGFVGRRAQLQQLSRLFNYQSLNKASAKTICIHGMGGMGKTTLAARFIDNFQNRGFRIIAFVGGILEHEILNQIVEFADLQQQPELKAILAATGSTPEGKIDFLVQTFLAEKNCIILFDNFEDNQWGGAAPKNLSPGTIKSESLKSFLYQFSKSIQKVQKDIYLVFTSRYIIEELPLQFMPLGAFSFFDTYKWINRSRGLVHLSLKQREEVHTYLGGHPRSLELLNSYVNHTQASWKQIRSKFEMVRDFAIHQDLLLQLLWEKLTAQQQSILLTAATFRSLTHYSGLLALVDLELPSLKAELQLLNSFSLLYLEQDYFLVHQLTNTFLKKYQDKAQKKNWHKMAGDHFVENIKNAGQSTLEYAFEARYHYFQAKEFKSYSIITLALGDKLEEIGHLKKTKELLEESIPMITSGLEGKTFSDLGRIFIRLGDKVKAMNYLKKAEQFFHSINDINGLGVLHHLIGGIHAQSGNLEEAIIQLNQAIKFDTEANNIAGAINSYIQLGSINYELGRLDEAISIYQSLLPYVTQNDLHSTLGSIYSELGKVYKKGANYKRALAFHFKALQIRLPKKNLFEIRHSLKYIGDLYEEMGNYKNATNFINQSLQIAQNTNHQSGISSCFQSLGRICLKQRQYGMAKNYFLESLSIAKTINTFNLIGSSLIHLGRAHQLLGESDAAIKNYEEAIAVYQNQPGKAHDLIVSKNYLGKEWLKLEEYEKAHQQYLEASELARQSIDHVAYSESVYRLAEIAFFQKNYALSQQFISKITTPNASKYQSKKLQGKIISLKKRNTEKMASNTDDKINSA